MHDTPRQLVAVVFLVGSSFQRWLGTLVWPRLPPAARKVWSGLRSAPRPKDGDGVAQIWHAPPGVAQNERLGLVISAPLYTLSVGEVCAALPLHATIGKLVR